MHMKERDRDRGVKRGMEKRKRGREGKKKQTKMIEERERLISVRGKTRAVLFHEL